MELENLSQKEQPDNEKRKLTVEDIDKVRHIEGFPIAKDEDIIALSEPPYYTACPNPFLQEFIEEHGKPYDPETDDYHREPFAADVSEGKNNPIYNAHSYHTKVPHKAIMRYILHYTDPGDIVYDGFCGTGMTGVAAQMCGNPDPEFEFQIEKEMPGVKWGARKAILCDLSPVATFIAYSYNTPVDVEAFEREAKRILEEVEVEYGWMYETNHVPEGGGETKKGKINYTVWSDVFICSECAEEIIFWEAAVDHKAGKVRKTFQCPHCNASLTKSKIDRATETVFDDALNTTITRVKQVPVLINYIVEEACKTKRYEKKPDADDLSLIDKIESTPILYWFPTDKIPEGDKTQDPIRLGITHVHHFYNKRNLWVLSVLRSRALSGALLVVFQSIVSRLCSKLVVYSLGKRGNVSLSGTLYIPSLVAEAEVLKVFKSKFQTFLKVFRLIHTSGSLSTVQSSSQLLLESDNVDYIFTDPPFGCLPAGTKIITTNGYKPIEEIQAGDRVLSHKGRFCRVIRTFQRHHQGRMMKIQVAYTNEQLHITPNHRMRVIRTVDCNYNFKYCRPSCSHLLQENYTCTHFDNYALSWTPAGEVKPYDVLFMPSFSEEIENPRGIDLSNELPDYYADGEFLYYEKLRQDTLQIRAALTAPDFEYAHGKIKAVAEELSQPYHVVSRIWNTEIKRNRSPQYKLKQNFPMTEDFARLVGYFVADGSTDVRSDGGTLNFHFHAAEVAYREDVSGIMRRIFDSRGGASENGQAMRINVLLETSCGIFPQNIWREFSYQIATGVVFATP